MRNKYFILLSLLSAYLLMFAHSVIPHHHHESKQEADKHHQSEHAEHHHDNGEKSEGHGHTPHFVHSPDFGNYVVTPSFKLNDVPQFHLAFFFIASTSFNYSFETFVKEVDWFPDLPPPYKNYAPLPNGLRGSPIFIS